MLTLNVCKAEEVIIQKVFQKSTKLLFDTLTLVHAHAEHSQVQQNQQIILLLHRFKTL